MAQMKIFLLLLTLDALFVQRWPALLAADRACLATGARRDGHVVLVAACQQAVPVGDERQPHVLPPLRHRLRHELLQVRVAAGKTPPQVSVIELTIT